VRAGSVRECIPGQRVRELAESVLTSREFLPELDGGETRRVPQTVSDLWRRLPVEGSVSQTRSFAFSSLSQVMLPVPYCRFT
jgi:hypothetical protein